MNAGTIFDVSAEKDVYRSGKSYNIFVGKGLREVKSKSRVYCPDYTDLTESEMRVLNDWHSFFSYVIHFYGSIVYL